MGSPTAAPHPLTSPLARKLIDYDNKKGSGWAQLIGLVLFGIVVIIAECIKLIKVA